MNFIFILVDRGCFFIQEKKGRILSKSFYETFESFKDQNLLHQNPAVPLHVFFDSHDQTYKRETFPPMPVWKRRKILKHRSGFKDSEIHWIKEDKNTYLFVDLKLSKEQKSWLQFLETLINPILPLRLIPLEIAVGVENLSTTILMYEEEHVGLRQVVVQGGKFLLTRLVPPLAAETTQLLTYLKTTYGIEDVKIISLESYFEEVMRIVHQVSILPLRLNLWASYYKEEHLRKILQGLSFLCILVLMGGSFYLDNQNHEREKLRREKEQALAIMDEKLKALPPVIMRDDLQKSSLWDHYHRLKSTILNPFNLLEKFPHWLDDHWQVTDIHWCKDTEESFKVGLQYLGPRYESKDALRVQAAKPLAPYVISISKDTEGRGVLGFKRPVEVP